MKNHLLLCLIACSVFSCRQPSTDWKAQVADARIAHLCENQLTKVVVYDVFSPPVACRVYVYPNIAAHEALAAGNAGITSLAGKLNGLEPLPQPDKNN
jgi:hypothetical protein